MHIDLLMEKFLLQPEACILTPACATGTWPPIFPKNDFIILYIIYIKCEVLDCSLLEPVQLSEGNEHKQKLQIRFQSSPTKNADWIWIFACEKCS